MGRVGILCSHDYTGLSGLSEFGGQSILHIFLKANVWYGMGLRLYLNPVARRLEV